MSQNVLTFQPISKWFNLSNFAKKLSLLYFQVPLTTELKFAECLDISVQMCITKLKNDNEKDNICTECANINFVILFLFLRVILAVCI